MESYRELAKLCAALRRAHNVAEPADRPVIAHAIIYYNNKLKEIDGAIGRYCGPGGDYIHVKKVSYTFPVLVGIVIGVGIAGLVSIITLFFIK